MELEPQPQPKSEAQPEPAVWPEQVAAMKFILTVGDKEVYRQVHVVFVEVNTAAEAFAM